MDADQTVTSSESIPAPRTPQQPYVDKGLTTKILTDLRQDENIEFVPARVQEHEKARHAGTFLGNTRLDSDPRASNFDLRWEYLLRGSVYRRRNGPGAGLRHRHSSSGAGDAAPF